MGTFSQDGEKRERCGWIKCNFRSLVHQTTRFLIKYGVFWRPKESGSNIMPRPLINKPCKMIQHVATCCVYVWPAPAQHVATGPNNVAPMLYEMLHPFDRSFRNKTQKKNCELQRGSTEPMTSAIPVRCSTHWGMEPRWKQVRCEFNLYPLYEGNYVMYIMIKIIWVHYG